MGYPMPNRKYFLLGTMLAVLFSTMTLGFFYTQRQTIAFWNQGKNNANKEEPEIPSDSQTKDKDIIKKVEIGAGDNYIDVMERADIGYSQAMEIYDAAKPEYDLARISAGESLQLTYTRADRLKRIMYNIDTEKRLIIEDRGAIRATTTASTTKEGDNIWQAEVEPIPYEVEIAVSEGEIETSMYEAAQEQDLDIRTIIKLAEAFQWIIDFAMETRKGDAFKLVYEKKYLDGEYIRPGRILAARYVNNGEEHEIFYYKESPENKGYFSYDGESAQKMFLKAPVAYKYISSGYTRGPRYLASFKMYTSSHKAIDYAAETGTPIRAVGNGTVVTAGWSSAGYGYLTTIRHNSTFTTRYAHQSRIAVRPGESVSQGQVIGYVGSTGFSTGPHLHYEMLKHGAKINPLSLELPPSDSISKENLKAFQESIRPYKEKLDAKAHWQ
jgi:murein DD-endopeptidase MepM/ murein hydrolase activator NlpD